TRKGRRSYSGAPLAIEPGAPQGAETGAPNGGKAGSQTQPVLQEVPRHDRAPMDSNREIGCEVGVGVGLHDVAGGDPEHVDHARVEHMVVGESVMADENELIVDVPEEADLVALSVAEVLDHVELQARPAFGG